MTGIIFRSEAQAKHEFELALAIEVSAVAVGDGAKGGLPGESWIRAGAGSATDHVTESADLCHVLMVQQIEALHHELEPGLFAERESARCAQVDGVGAGITISVASHGGNPSGAAGSVDAAGES